MFPINAMFIWNTASPRPVTLGITTKTAW